MQGTGAPAVTGSDLTLARSLVYRLLSQALAYPMPGTVSALLEEDLPLARAWQAELAPPVREALDALAAVLEGDATADLETAYRDAFSHIHSSDRPMYETDYGARDVWRQSDTLADIAGFYRAFGIHEAGERPDHVSAELEFLHVVSYKAAWAQANDDEEHARVCLDAEATFLRDHALRWVPAFAARTLALGDGAYAAVARLADALMRAEADRLGLQIPDDVVPAPPAEEEPPALCEEEP
jgi:putative dimethyl sulfoxide reductase chaperone